MTELKELEEGLRNLKKDNVEKKRLISELENEKKYLEERNRYLIEKLKQAGVLYEESGKRLMDFVNENVKPLKAKLEDFDVRLQKIKEYDKSINSALEKVIKFESIVGNFKNEVLKSEEKQAEISAKLSEMKKLTGEVNKRISTVQTFGSEELGEKVEGIKAKFGEETRKIEDEFSILKIGVGNVIDNFKKEFERQANALRNEMDKVDIKKAKELGDALAHVTEELDKTKVDFSKSMASMEKIIERLDIKKTKEMEKALEILSANLDEKFANLTDDLNKRVMTAESDLNRFRIELEKTLGKAKIETRDFVASKSKEFDALLAQLKEKMNEQVQASVEQWNNNLGSLRSDLINTKKEVEQLIGTINRKVEIGEERREKKVDIALVQMNASLSKRLESETEQIYGEVGEIGEEVEDLKASLAKAMESLKKAEYTNDAKRKAEINKIVKDLMVIKGEVDEKINEVSAELEKFSKMSETLRKQITKESLAGVQDRIKIVIEELEKKFEVVEDSMIDKIASLESDLEELSANSQGITNSLKMENDKKLEFLRKEFERRDLKRDKDGEAFAKSLQREVDTRFTALTGKIDSQMKETGSETSSLRKEVDNFTITLSEKFDSIIKAKSKEFEKLVSSLFENIKSIEKELNLTINAFKKDIEKSEMQKKAEVEKTLKEFIAEKGKIDEKMRQVDLKIAEFSEMRKELKKEIYKESLAGVNERVKDIVGGIEERLGSTKDETENKVSELMKNVDTRVREVESNLNSFKVELEKIIGKLRTDVDKVTVKKTGEIDRIADKLRTDVQERVEATTSELYDDLDMIKSDFASTKMAFEKSLASLKKEFEASETRRGEKVEKVKTSLDREFKVKFDDFTVRMGERLKADEVEIKVLKGEVDSVVDKLNDKFEAIIKEKSDNFEVVMEGVVEKSEKAKKDVELLAETLKAKFQAGEKERWKETDMSLKEMMVVKGEIGRRLKELDDEVKKFYGIKDSLKDELMKGNATLIENKLASFSDYKKSELSETKKALKLEISEAQSSLVKLGERLGKLDDKMNVLRDELYTIKKSRAMTIENVRLLNKTVEDDVDLKIKNFMKDLEKRMRTQESVLNSRMAEVEKKIGSVSESVAKTKKEKEEELEELLRHVES